MSKSHRFETCRELYRRCRIAGSPPVNILNMGSGYMFGETSDGAIIFEGITGCCKWAMKYKVARAWLDKQAGAPSSALT
jgi:hypothetical protein